MNEGFGRYRYYYGIYPISTENYNLYSFIFYTVAPIFIIIIIRLWRKDKKKKPQKNIIPVTKSNSSNANSQSSISDKDNNTANRIISPTSDLNQIASLPDHKAVSNEIPNNKESKTESADSKTINRLRFVIVILSIGLSIIYYIPDIVNYHFNSSIPLILGGALGLGIIPGIIGLIRMSMKKKPSLNITAIYLLIILVSFFLAYSGKNALEIFSAKSTENYKPKDKPLDFSSSEYFISFPYPYSEGVKYTSFEGGVLKSITAEVVIEKEKSLLRAEYAYLDTSFIEGVNKSEAIKRLNKYAIHQGLNSITSEYTEDHIGKIAKLRGYKTLVDEYGSDIKMTFEMIALYGKGSIMILYFGSPSENYPTPSITKFRRSIKKL